MYMKKIFALLSVCVVMTATAAPLSDSQMLGSRICLLHPYEWTESATGVVTVAPADPFNVGGWTTIISQDGSGQLVINGGLAMYDVALPFTANYTSGTVTITVGEEPFGTMSGTVTTTSGSTTTTVDSTLYFYVVNEDWLVNYGELRDVTGRIEADGSIVIDEGFCYYIEKEKKTTVTANNGSSQTFTDMTTSYTPLYRNTRLVKPNGIHEYVSEADGLMHTNEVYISQDGETVHVVNLYGLGWPDNTMTLHSDGTMTFPGQAFCDINDAEYPSGSGEWYNASLSGSSLTLGNEGTVTTNAITWGLLRPTDDSDMSWPGWNNNKLYYTDGSTFVIPGEVTVIRGDVNDDGYVNINDVTALIDAVLNGNWDGLNYANADCNLDESVNINDVTTLIDYVLGGVW